MIQIVRHAQSVANAGVRVENNRIAGLSELGMAQAEALADSIDTAPDYLIVSDAVRTQATAAPLMKKFPDLMMCTMPVYEFYFISDYRMRGTTPDERKKLLDEYFAKNDPGYKDGENCESFNQFISRVRGFLDSLDRTKNILIISHGHFINGVKLVLENRQPTVAGFAHMQYVEHCEGIEL